MQLLVVDIVLVVVGIRMLVMMVLILQSLLVWEGERMWRMVKVNVHWCTRRYRTAIRIVLFGAGIEHIVAFGQLIGNIASRTDRRLRL